MVDFIRQSRHDTMAIQGLFHSTESAHEHIRVDFIRQSRNNGISGGFNFSRHSRHMRLSGFISVVRVDTWLCQGQFQWTEPLRVNQCRHSRQMSQSGSITVDTVNTWADQGQFYSTESRHAYQGRLQSTEPINEPITFVNNRQSRLKSHSRSITVNRVDTWEDQGQL